MNIYIIFYKLLKIYINLYNFKNLCKTTKIKMKLLDSKCCMTKKNISVSLKQKFRLQI